MAGLKKGLISFHLIRYGMACEKLQFPIGASWPGVTCANHVSLHAIVSSSPWPACAGNSTPEREGIFKKSVCSILASSKTKRERESLTNRNDQQSRSLPFYLSIDAKNPRGRPAAHCNLTGAF